MTKSRTLRKAGAVALSLAMALSIAGTIPASAAAKKVKLSSTKGTITVGKTKKVTIKNTKKANIKKVTFKYSNTKKRVTAKRSGLTLKFKGNKAGTVTITSKITLKKAVAGKKTYSLKYKATVKKATPAPTATPGELKLDSVESAGRINGNVNILVAYFSGAMSDIVPTDVQIRRVSDNRLFTVEKVVMGSDKKSATMNLTGTAAAATDTEYLVPNTDYKMIVTLNGKTYEKTFTVPRIWADAVCTGVDASKKKITVWGSDFTVGDGVTVDYNEVLGRTITFQYDKNFVIQSLTINDETVLYGAFEKTDDGKLKNSKTKDTYAFATQDVGSIYTSEENNLDGEGSVMNGNKVEYAKVTLNGNGTVRYIVSITDFEDVVYVASVKDNDLVKVNDTTVSLKDYNIFKAGKTIQITDIQPGDVVFVDTTKKHAEVYMEDSVSGKLKAYTDKFDIDTTRYDLKGDLVNGKSDAQATNASIKGVDGGNATVYFKRNGDVAKIVMTDNVAKNNESWNVITKAAKVYTSGSKYVIDFSADDGTGAKDYTVDPTKLEIVSGKAGTAAVCKKVGDVNVASFDVEDFDADGFKGNISSFTSAGASNNDDLIAEADLAAGVLVKLTKKEDGTIVGIELSEKAAGAADLNLDTDAVAANTNIGTVGDTAGTFKAGASEITDTHTTANNRKKYLLPGTTPVLVYYSDSKSVKATTYGEVDFTFTIDDAAPATAVGIDGVVRVNTTTVKCIAIDAARAGLSASKTTTKRGVIVSTTFDQSTTKKLVDITIAYGTKNDVKYDSPANDILESSLGVDIDASGATDKDDWVAGTVVDLVENADGKVTKVTALDPAGAKAVAVTYANKNKDDYVLNTGANWLVTKDDASVTTTIVTVSDDKKTVTPLTWDQYCNSVKAVEVASVKGYLYAGKFCDVVVVQLKSAAAVANAKLDDDIVADITSLVADESDAASITLPATGSINGATYTYTITTAGTKAKSSTGNALATGSYTDGSIQLLGATGTNVVIKVTASLDGAANVIKTITISDGTDPTKADITVG